jgi:hypothetical protein
MDVERAQGVLGLLAVLGPLLAVQVTVVIFYLRSLREHQVTRDDELSRRMVILEDHVEQSQLRVADIERGYATKEEWLRECMLARQQIDQLMQTMVRVETELEQASGVAGRIDRATKATIDAADRVMQFYGNQEHQDEA